MASTYKTPGVYVEEISKLPPSVAEVETAIPAFVGYTEMAKRYVENDLHNVPTRIKSLLEYEQYFGKGPSYSDIHVQLDSNNIVDSTTTTVNNSIYNLYESMRLFYDNGGGVCYVCSVGLYDDADDDGTRATNITNGLAELKKFDEPTLLLFPDAVNIMDSGAVDWDKLAGIQQAALKQCGDLGDRFAILDVPDESSTTVLEEADTFRSKIGMNNLKYGAAYSPFVKTIYDKEFLLSDICKNLYQSDGVTKTKLKALFSDSDLDSSGNKIKDKLDEFELLYTDNDNINARFCVFSGQDPTDTFNSSSLDTFYQFASSAFKTAANDADRKTALTNGFKFIYASFLQFEGLVKTHGGKVNVTNNPTTTGNMGIFDAAKPIRTALITNPTLLTSVQGILATNLKTALQTFVDLDFEANDAASGKIAKTAVQDLTLLTDTSWVPVAGSDKAVLTGGASVTANGTIVFTQLDAIFKILKSGFSLVVSNAEASEEATEKALIPSLPMYNSFLKVLNAKVNTLPPSGAVAGIYAAVDRDRGVWKAPANVSINSVSDVSETIDDSDQESLNVDANAGKSINAIRPFYGKGILVWGARTLAGNDNEWRYVPVRRLFSFVEESCKKSTSWCVFEPNDANTWARIRSQIDNFLNNMWKLGALAGAKPEHAYYVNCGLGVTMSSQDILEGRLIVEVAMAAVRPAEFVILKFSHKLQQS